MSMLEADNRLLLHLQWRLVSLALLCAALSVAPLRAQDDVAEAARQARAHKATQQNVPHHVYTEEELKRGKILKPEDEARATAHKASLPGPAEESNQPQVAEQKPTADQDQVTEQKVDAPQKPAEESLGEVARRYRKEKEARQEEGAAKDQRPSRYPLELSVPTLAAPNPEIPVGNGSLRPDEMKPTLGPIPFAPPIRSNFPSRLSPFVPRATIAPRKPEPNVSLSVLAGSVHREPVQPGDSWWKLARRYLGQGSRWEELLRVNPGLSRDPNKLMAGTIVFVPESSLRPRTEPPGLRIVVQKGDTLWSLSRKHLGCGEQWTQLAAANPEITEFRNLQIGRKLRLPDHPTSACADRAARP